MAGVGKQGRYTPECGEGLDTRVDLPLEKKVSGGTSESERRLEKL